MRALAGPLVGAVLLLAACARATPPPPLPAGVTAGRVLVVSRVVDAGNRAVVDRVTDLLVAALGEGAQVVGRQRFLAESRAGAAPWAGRALDRFESGGWPTRDEADALSRQLGIGALLTTGVNSYDQVWGKYAKFTRVAVEVDAFDLRAGHVVWRMQTRKEVEEMRGRAFEHAMEQAVGDVVAAIQPSRGGISLIDLWRSWRR
jgi:hypothetical protein